jgi:hypothetical protein
MCFSIDAKGKKTRLTDGKGTHDATFNAVFSLFYRQRFNSRIAKQHNSANKYRRSCPKTSIVMLPWQRVFSFKTSEKRIFQLHNFRKY